MLDDRAPWWSWIVGRDHLPLKRAVEDATEASHIYGRISHLSLAIYSPGDPAYDEFLRRLTKIWIEAAGLYGIRQTADTARAEPQGRCSQDARASDLLRPVAPGRGRRRVPGCILAGRSK